MSMGRRFAGRDEELATLRRHLDAVASTGEGRALLLRGRRRVGKSRLAEEFIARSGSPSLFFTATRQGAGELALFADEAAASDLPGAPFFRDIAFDTWHAALHQLAQALPRGDEGEPPNIVVVDEVPYLLEADPTFDAILQRAWDRELSRRRVLLLLIGSDLSVMERLDRYDAAFHGRATPFLVRELPPPAVGDLTHASSAAAAFDAYLLSGGLPELVGEWPDGGSHERFLAEQFNDPTSPLVVAGERALTGELPEDTRARDVLGAIGSGERTFTRIRQRVGAISEQALANALERLRAKRLVARELPLSTKPSKEARYHVGDPYLRFWLRFVGPNLPLLERGRADRLLEDVRSQWETWRGHAVEPIVRDALTRMEPLEGCAATPAVGGYWTRRNQPQIDLVGADRDTPPVQRIGFVGSIKWREHGPFGARDLAALNTDAEAVPGVDIDTPRVAVARARVETGDVDVALTAEDLITAWA